MRTIPIIALVLLALSSGTVGAQRPDTLAGRLNAPSADFLLNAGNLEADSLLGAWERVFVRVILPDTTLEEVFTEGPRLHKLLTPSHFAFGRQEEDGEDVFAGGGRYAVSGDTYTESYDYHASPSMVGRSITFDTYFEGGRWHISGVIGRFRLEETWRRLQ